MTSCLLSCPPSGSKSFPFRVDPFPKGRDTFLTELPPLKVYQFPLEKIIASSEMYVVIFFMPLPAEGKSRTYSFLQ